MWVNVTRSESVFDKSSDEEMSEMTCDEYPVRTKQKKPCGEKEGWRFKRNNKIKNILKQICPNFCKFVENTFFVLFFILHRPAVRISLPFHDIHYSPACFFAINVFLVMFIYILSCYIILAHSTDHCACIAYRDMKHLESSECTQMKSQNDRLSPEIPPESRANSWVPVAISIWWNCVDPALAVSYPDKRKTAKNLADSRKNWKILTVSRK